jgi:hypothetical protein
VSEADVEVIRRFHRVSECGDLEALADLLHPDVVWRGTRPGAECTNREDVLNVLDDRMDHVPPLDRLELVDLGDEVMVGLPMEEPWEVPGFYQRVRVHNGQLVEIQDYGPREAAVSGILPR